MRHRPRLPEPEPTDLEEGQLALFDELPSGGERARSTLPVLEPMPLPPAHVPRRLSYSAIALFDNCSYRYYAERILGLRPRDDHVSSSRGEAGGLAATEIGDAAHRLLELVPLDAPAPPAADELAATVRGWYPSVSDEELERIAGFVAAYCASPLAHRIASEQDVRPERPFAFEHDGVLFHGRLDALSLTDARALVVDYKTNQLATATPDDIVREEYGFQRAVYAFACLRPGSTRSRWSIVPGAPRRACLGDLHAEERAALESELSAAITRIREGDFRPTPSEFACSGCPALDVVCAGPRLGGGEQWASAPELTAAG